MLKKSEKKPAVVAEKPVEKPVEARKPDKILELNLKDQLPWLPERIIFLTKHGSHAYGTNTPESDDDFRGVVIPPLPYFFGSGVFQFEQAIELVPDLVFYDIRKFIRLAAKANPNILELLFVAPEHIMLCNPLMNKILEHRDLFVTQLVSKTYVGYAISQLKALRKSLVTPPSRSNSKRAKSIEENGFDTKDAMHVVRLLRMGLEILEGKGVIVSRPDAEELLNIKAGAWDAKTVFEFAAEAEKKILEVLPKSKLPKAPDMVKIDSLCTAIVQASFDHEIKIPIMQTGFGHQDWVFHIGNLKARKLSPQEEA